MSYRLVASPELQQQLLRQVRSLTVEKLKKVLRNTNLTVTGNKAILIERIISELNLSIRDNDYVKFARLRQFIQNPDHPPSIAPPSSNPSFAYEGQKHLKQSFPNGASTTVYSHSTGRPGVDFAAKLKFRTSPFYTDHEDIGSRRLLDVREQSRDILTFTFRLRGDILDRLRRDHKVRVLLYCGTDDALRIPADINFPSNFELKVNELEVRANFKGLKNKPGTTRPVDVTGLVSKSSNHENTVWLTWAVTTRRYHVAFFLARQHDPSELVQRMKEAKRISKNSVIKEMSAWAGDNDLIATSSRMSLKCPLSTMRIETPCRSSICKHNQCFDALSFLQLQEQAPQWHCPVCNKHVPFEYLQVDDYVKEILDSTSRSTEQVTVEPDGQWLYSDMEKGSMQEDTQGIKKEDTDANDDIVEILDISPKRVNGLSQSSCGNTTELTNVSRHNATMMPSSSNKRPAPQVIDLTGDSDDENDEPIRPPAKRHMADTVKDFPWADSTFHQTQGSVNLERGYSFSMPNRSTNLASGQRYGPEL